MRNSIKYFLIIYSLTLQFLILGCKDIKRNSTIVYQPKDTTLIKISKSLKEMTDYPRTQYKIIDKQEKIDLDPNDITSIKIRRSDFFNDTTTIDKLRYREISLGISELRQINKLNSSYLPFGKQYFSLSKNVGSVIKYNSRKTNAVIYGFAIIKSDNEYNSLYLVDTLDFNFELLGIVNNDLNKIVYQTNDINNRQQKFLLYYRNDTINRYELK